MRQRILKLFLMVLLGVFITQGIVWFPGIHDVSAIDSDYYSPFDVAYSPDGTMIAVSDLTNARLNIITASTGSIVRTIQLTGKPKGVAWNGNTRVYVAEYDAGTVAEIDPTDGSILRRFSTGRMPVGIAVASNKLAVTDFGLKQVTVIDLVTGNTLGSASVKDYPYFVDMTTTGTYAVVGHATPSGSAWNTGYAASVSFVDMDTRTVTTNLSLPMGSTNVKDIECSPDGSWVYVVHTLGRITLPTTQITKGWVNTDALTIINASTRSIYTTVLLDTLYEGAADPWGLAISSDSRTLWVSISGTHQVYKVDLYNLHQLLNGSGPARPQGDPTLTFRSKSGYNKPYSDIWFAIKMDRSKQALLKNNLGALYSAGLLTKIKLAGQGPRGIAISPDGTRVAVGAYFAGQIYLINTATNQTVQTIALGSQPAEDSVRRGERTFHDASTTTQKWLSCVTCHPEGRADGLNWDMPNDGIGTPKNTKSMYKVFDTPPAMWRGIREDATAGIIAGFKFIKFKTPTQQELNDVAAYIQSIEEETSPYCNADGSMTADALAGKALFESSGTQCATCHYGPNLTDLAVHDVGTKDAYDIDGNYVSPPLIELWRTAPYLHDGSAPTLRDVLTTKNAENRHGATSQLTSTQIDQLVAFLLQVKSGYGGPTPVQTPTPVRTPTPVSTSTPSPSPTPSAPSAFSQIEAESFTTQSGIQTESCDEGGQNIGYIENEDYAVYNNIDFEGGATSFQARVASNTSGGNIEIRLDSTSGNLIGTCVVAGTGGWQTWATSTCSVSGVSGTHNLYLKFTGGSGYLFNMNWFKFTKGSTPTPTPVLTPTPVVTTTPVVTPTPTPMVTPTPTPTSVVTPTPGAGNYIVVYTVQNDWGSGATVDVKIINNTGAAVNGWNLAFTFSGNQTITNVWSGTYTQSGASVTVKDAGYNAGIPENGGSVNFGFNLNYSGTNAKPLSFTLNGTACQVQ